MTPSVVVRGRAVLNDGSVIVSPSASITATGTAPSNPILGASMSDQTGHEPYDWEAARYYAYQRANHAINNHNARVHLFTSPPSDLARNTTTWVNAVKSIRDRCLAAGIANPEIHCGFDNEADREYTTSAEVASYKAWFKDGSQAVRTIPGVTSWMNLTRHGIGVGRNDQFVTSDMLPYIDGFAINCYSPGMEDTPIDYSEPIQNWMNPMFQWIKAKGVLQCSAWETGTRSDSRGLRPAYAKALAVTYRDRARFYGLNPRVISWWDNVTTTTRDSRFQTDGTATVLAWRSAYA